MRKLDRIVFFGTPDFAVPTLEALRTAGRLPHQVVTQPDRPAGRGRKLRHPPVALWAKREGVPVLQPRSVKDPEFLHQLARLRPQIAVVAAFGQIFPPDLLDLPEMGCMNLHASLLPRYRGASPIAAAIRAGDRSTGVSTMVMAEGLDDGPVLLQKETPIGDRETSGELTQRLARLGAELVVETLQGLESEEVEPEPQADDLATYAPRLKKSDGVADWTVEAITLFNYLRAYTPWPGLTAMHRDQPLRIVWGQPLQAKLESPQTPGTYLGLHGSSPEHVAVSCGGATVFGIEKLQRPGRQAIGAAEFVNGERLQVGEVFATPTLAAVKRRE